MSSIGTGYDLYTSQFSPDGRVFQIDYALKCVENSGTAIALRGKDGVVFAVEKIVTSKLYENPCAVMETQVQIDRDWFPPGSLVQKDQMLFLKFRYASSRYLEILNNRDFKYPPQNMH